MMKWINEVTIMMTVRMIIKMILTLLDLQYIDKKLYPEDAQRYSGARSNTIELLTRHTHPDCVKEQLFEIPFYWFHHIYPALVRMVQVYPKIQFIAIKSINYGIRIHHTSDTTVLNTLNKIKLELAGKIDEMIVDRVRDFYKKG